MTPGVDYQYLKKSRIFVFVFLWFLARNPDALGIEMTPFGSGLVMYTKGEFCGLPVE